MSQSQSMIRCEGLTKIYEGVEALVDLNLEIPKGHVFGYIGHNGAGKTTTIRILAGLLAPTSGRAAIAGVDVSTSRDRIKQLVGYMPDAFGVYDQMRVWEYLDFFGAAFKIPRKQRKERVEFVLELTESKYMRDRFVDTLSRGMKQRIGIARTLMHDPAVLLLDEPANGLDPQARVEMRHLLRRLAGDGKTVLVSSHILPELAQMSDSIGIIHQGRLKSAGPIDKVLSALQRDRLVEVRCLSGAADAARVLREVPTCSRIDESEAATGSVSFRYNGDDAGLAGILAKLVAQRVPVVTLREVPLSLEEAYMAISGVSEEQEQEERIEKLQKEKFAELFEPEGVEPKGKGPGAAGKGGGAK